MTTTARLGLPLIAAAQAQKHVTHNVALTALDALVFLSVLDRHRTAPPGAPAEGDRHIVATGASGDWSGLDGQVVARMDGMWRAYAPRAGWLAWVASERALRVHDGAAWIAVVPPAAPADVARRSDLLTQIALADVRGTRLFSTDRFADGFGDATGVSSGSWNTSLNAAGRYVGPAGAGDMGLVATSVAVEADPSALQVMLEIEPLGALVLGVDLFVDVSRDGGTTWGATTLTRVRTIGARWILDTGAVDVSSKPPGTSVRFQIRTANGRQLRVHGVAVHHG